MKKNMFFKTMLCFLIVTMLFGSIVIADDIDATNEEINISKEIDENLILETSASSSKNLQINSRAYVVMDAKTNRVLVGKKETEKRKMASTTKIMTALLVIEKGNLQDVVTVSKKAAGTGGSRLGLKTNDTITVHDLLYGLMLCSGNDAAVCLAEYISGSVDEFANLMNQKATELNLQNTHFVTPHGLDSEEHYTTAYELAILANNALHNSKFKEIVGTKNYTVTINHFPKTLSNTNELLGNLNGVYGVKTGFTNGANRCLVTACKRNDMDIICVVLGADTKKFRTQDSIKLIEYAFQNFECVNIQALLEEKFNKWKENSLDEFHILKGVPTSLSLTYSSLDTPVLPILKEWIPNLEVSIQAEYSFTAPIKEGTKMGSISLTSGNNEIVNADILTTTSISKKDMMYYLLDFFKNYPNYLAHLNFFVDS